MVFNFQVSIQQQKQPNANLEKHYKYMFPYTVCRAQGVMEWFYEFKAVAQSHGVRWGNCQAQEQATHSHSQPHHTDAWSVARRFKLRRCSFPSRVRFGRVRDGVSVYTGSGWCDPAFLAISTKNSAL